MGFSYWYVLAGYEYILLHIVLCLTLSLPSIHEVLSRSHRSFYAQGEEQAAQTCVNLNPCDLEI